MPKINQEEYEVLQFLNNTKDWIVRNPDGQLWAVEGEAPWKAPFYEMWKENDGQDTTKVDVNSFLFQFIQWEDEEPYNIAELIEEYLYDNRPKLFIDGQEQSFEFIEESEEKEAKSKQELIEKWESAIEAAEFYGKGKEDKLIEYMRNFVDDLNQLDEPEVLSQEWIDEHKENWQDLSVTGYSVPEKDLQNLLVPKKEEVDQAYKDGYETGKQHATEKQSEETETVARVLVDYLIASAKLKLALSMEVEELEE